MRIPGVESGSINGKDRDPLHDILLNRVSIADVRDILNVERGSVHYLHRNVIQRFDG